MSRLDPQVLAWSTLATLAVVAGDLAGLFEPWKEHLHDLQQRHMPRQVTSMSEDIVLVDIDDRALERLGRWPWPRTALADAIQSLNDAGARTIAIDVDLADPQEPTFTALGDAINHDAVLARALDDRVVMAVLLMPDELDARWLAAGGTSTELSTVISMIEANPALDPRTGDIELSASGREAAADTLHLIRRRAVERLVRSGLSRDDIRDRAGDEWAAVRASVDAAINRHRAVEVLPGTTTGGRSAPPTPGDRFPRRGFVEDAGGTGYVNIALRGSDGGIRRLYPLLDVGDDLRVPPLGIAAAAHFLGHSGSDAHIDDDHFVIGDVRLPVRDESVAVSWPRGHAGMDWPDLHRDEGEGRFAGHLSIAEIVLLGRARRALAAHDTGISEATRDLLRALRSDPSLTAENWQAPELQAEIADEVDFTIGDASTPAQVDEALGDVDEATRALAHRMLDWKRHVVARDTLEQDIDAVAATLEQAVKDRLVFIGWTATGTAADFVPTAAGARTPGVLVHAAMADMILQRRVLHELPRWWSPALAMLVGLVVACIVGRLGPWPATLCTSLILVTWLALVAVLYWKSSLAVPIASPVLACTLAWGAGIGSRAALVQREKRRVTRQFRARVPAALVDELADNPEALSMTGVSREVCVMFGDLAGFTGISERLGSSDTVALLNRAMSGLAAELTSHDAYLNKFLGDGFLAFWSAFGPEEDQARLAVLAAHECQSFMQQLNSSLPADSPSLGLRIGIATGEAIVGDCGAPPELNDYTVIGDVANLAARLESANKQLGTAILVDGRTRALLEDDAMGLWPTGPLVVVGRDAVVETWGWAPGPVTDDARRAAETLVSCISSGDRPGAVDARSDLTAMPAHWLALVDGVIQAPDPMPRSIVLHDK